MTPRPSGTCAMPSRTICSTGRPVMSRPSSRTRPDHGRTSPLTARSRVVLPAPFAPSTAVMLPSSARNETPFNARTASYRTARSRTSSTVRLLLDGLAEIGLDDRRVIANPRRLTAGDDLAEVEDDDLVGHPHDKVHVVLDEHHRKLAAQPFKEVPQFR